MTEVETAANGPDASWAAAELLARAEGCPSLSPAWLVPLAALDPKRLSPDEQVSLALVMQRMTAVTEAAALRALEAVPNRLCVPDPHLLETHPDAAARLCPGGSNCPHRWEVEELSALTGVSRHAMGRRRGLAWKLADAWPALMPLLAGGRITVEHLQRFDLATLNANEQAMAAAVEAFVTLMEQEPCLPVERLARVARRVVARHTEPAEAKTKAERNLREETGVTFEALGDGIAALTLTGETHKLEAIRALIAEHPAITHPDPDDDRTKGQRQVDLLVGLCLMGTGYGANTGPNRPGSDAPDGGSVFWPGTSEAAEPRIAVTITASMETLCGVSNEPGFVGDSVVSAALTRQWAADPDEARRAITDHHGHVTSVSRRQRFPAGRLKRAIQLRWSRCTFPGCNRRSQESQIDHSDPYALGGETTLEKLHPLCHKHHMMKGQPGVHVRLTDDGTAVWTMPSGRTVRVPAWDYTVPEGPHDRASDDNWDWEPPAPTAWDVLTDRQHDQAVAALISQDPERAAA